MCAHEQGKFWEYHDAIFENQGSLATADLKRHAADLGLDVDSFNECVDSGRFREDVQKDYIAGGKLGVNATPAFFVNGRFISGAQPFAAFQSIIDEELSN